MDNIESESLQNIPLEMGLVTEKPSDIKQDSVYTDLISLNSPYKKSQQQIIDEFIAKYALENGVQLQFIGKVQVEIS